MKYSQFSELNDLLKKNKVSLDEWKKNPDMKLLKEAEEGEESKEGEKKELDTKKGNILTKRGRQRSILNKQAKKLQEQINKDIADKFLKPIFDLKAQVYKKMAEMGKGKQPKEIIAALKVDLGNIQKTQAKQMKLIEQSAQKAIDIMTQKIEPAIDKSKLNDTNKANMKTYWNLLTTQIMMNLLQKIAVKDEGLIGEIIKDEGIIKAAQAINRAINKEFIAQQERKKQETLEGKKKVKEADTNEDAGSLVDKANLNTSETLIKEIMRKDKSLKKEDLEKYSEDELRKKHGELYKDEMAPSKAKEDKKDKSLI